MTVIDNDTLDLYSTSQTDLGFLIQNQEKRCIYHAPYFAFQLQGRVYGVSQGNCHHWDCPRCGIARAKQEYWRIVKGCQNLTEQGKKLWFITITARGSGLKVEDAEKQYLGWTNVFLTNLRTYAKRNKHYWCYVQVTERQVRCHPHSHILTTFYPDDAVEGCVLKWEDIGNGRKSYWQEALRSDYIQSAVCSAGLGDQYDFSEVRSPEAVSRYVGKYLFKSSLLTVWPKGWRRVRYSQNWPKNEQPSTGDAFPLIAPYDWYRLADMAVIVKVKGAQALEECQHWLTGFNGVVIKEKGAKEF